MKIHNGSVASKENWSGPKKCHACTLSLLFPWSQALLELCVCGGSCSIFPVGSCFCFLGPLEKRQYDKAESSLDLKGQDWDSGSKPGLCIWSFTINLSAVDGIAWEPPRERKGLFQM